MRFICKRFVDAYLRDCIKDDSKYLSDSDPNDVQQAKENVEELKSCIEGPEAARLISDWNALIKTAEKIQHEATLMNPVFGRYFQVH